MQSFEAPQFDQEHGLGFTIASARYHRELTDEFAEKFSGEIIRIKKIPFDNGMPLYVVGSAKNALYLMWLPGENYDESFADMCQVGSALKSNIDQAGPNAARLGIFAPFFDARMDKRGRKDMPNGDDGRAIVRSQGATMPAVARAMRHVTLADWFGTLDFHSFEAANIIQQNGLDFINLTTARLFADIIESSPKTGKRKVVVALDAGDFNRAVPLQQHLDADLAAIIKVRNQEENVVDSKTKSKLVFGSVKGADVYILDDSISGGGTTVQTIELLIENEAASITLCATHPIFVQNYYFKLERALRRRKVKQILVTDSLPTEFRTKPADLPYVKTGRGIIKEVEVIPVGQFLADAAHTILHAESISEAKRALGPDVWDMQDPHAMYERITGLPAQRSKDTGVYLGGQRFAPFGDIYQAPKK